MPEPLGPPQPPEIRRSYPHLLPQDTTVWTRWLEHNAHRITGVWYDVHVGTPVQVDDRAPDWLRRVAAGVTRKRIDVVAKAPPETWVIEIKPYGSYTALGQALVYSRLFRVEHQPYLPVVPLVICAEIDPDIVDDFVAYGARFEEVGYAAS